MTFKGVYDSLNQQQRQAVDAIYGPVLVLAGPGTGKTQLLSARIANILDKTDANPQNIVCLTFTESAAQNMRERLSSMIFDDAYDVHINTYHGFGSDIIRMYPEYFEEINLDTGKDSRLERPIDELQALQIIDGLLQKLPYSSTLISARHYPKNVLSTISELKRALISPTDLKRIAKENLTQVHSLSDKIASTLSSITRFPSKASESIEIFSKIADILEYNDGLAKLAYDELQDAMHKAEETEKSTPLTAWKNTWLKKDETNRFIFTSVEQHEKLLEFADLFTKYQDTLRSKNMYDFDDMILRSIEVLRANDDLRYTLQEKYQFILLDEFQDTNKAQFELVHLLADNPVHEGQPNIFAVGDDDQAIYAFQGAQVSNMLAFTEQFKNVAVINLTENYRSHADIIKTAENVADQIETRLHYKLDAIDKKLIAKSAKIPKTATIQRVQLSAEANEYSWVSSTIANLIKTGTNPNDIAILAPQHKYLERVVPFLAKNKIPITYEKREDILQTQLIRSFKMMCELIIACNEQNTTKMNVLFPQVLSLEFYAIDVSEIWGVNWQLYGKKDTNWAQLALKNPMVEPIVSSYLWLGLRADTEPLEFILDYLTGSIPIRIRDDYSFVSPLKKYYFSTANKDTLRYYELLTNLSTIREHIRSHQAGEEKMMKTRDFLAFIHAYELAEQPLLNTHPIAQSTESVKLMTTYKAKGLEFEHVFLLSVHDDIWGKKARNSSNNIQLPANLSYIRYRGSTEDELRRLLFVAITRAKHGLYISSHAMKDNGKITEPVKYLLEFDDQDTRKTQILPETFQQVLTVDTPMQETMEAIETLWHSRHLDLAANLQSLLQDRLSKYQMSPTHLNMFIDEEHGGPEAFLLQTLLRFPQAPSESGEFGNAIHGTLDWYQKQLQKNNIPTEKQVLFEFNNQLNSRYLPAEKIEDLRIRGQNALQTYLQTSTIFNRNAISEIDFKNEGVVIGKARLSGKIDRLEIDMVNKTIDIVDFKTGKPLNSWNPSGEYEKVKANKYKQQLYFYVLLLQGSHTFQNFTVKSARLEFVEPITKGTSAKPLFIDFSSEELQDVKNFIETIWDKIQRLDLFKS